MPRGVTRSANRCGTVDRTRANSQPLNRQEEQGACE
jgi:hypothetical protein